jgi:quercetin dioxygenase-like cupin family protein
MPNVFKPDFDEHRDHEGFRAKRARVGRRLGTQRLGVSVWELPPGEAAYPYHAHLGDEELVIVLTGRPSLRTPGCWRELEEGEAVSFLRGEDGVHQIANRTDAPVAFSRSARTVIPTSFSIPTLGSSARPSGCLKRPGGSRSSFGSPTPSTTTSMSRRPSTSSPLATAGDAGSATT